MTQMPNTLDNVVKLPVAKKEKRRGEERWSPQAMKFGFTVLPNLLMRAQGNLKITPNQFNVLVQLAEHWWEAGKDPFPAKERIAKRMGKSPRMVQRYITELEKKGLVKRNARYAGKKAQTSNSYSLDGLIKKLKALEPEFTKAASLNKRRQQQLEAKSA